MLSEWQKAEVEERLRFIEEFLIVGRSTADMIRWVVRVFGITRRQAFRDLARVRAAWSKVAEKDRLVHLHLAIMQRNLLYQRALAEQDFSLALDILDGIARLQGLYPALLC